MTTASAALPGYWLASLAETLEPRPALAGERDADVVIVGAGYTGLWTAYYMHQLDPSRRIAIVESEVAGFGATGRNGGWCSGHYSGTTNLLRNPATREAGLAFRHASFDAAEEVGRVTQGEGIDCDYAKSGMLSMATCERQLERMQGEYAELQGFGFGEDYAWLDTEQCNARVRMNGCLGGLFSPHCAALHPAKLARGLAAVLEERGVVIYERSAARTMNGGAVTTEHGRLRAPIVLRCTEGYTSRLPGSERELLPLHSFMVATEPLSDATWQEIGAHDRVVFGDCRRTVTYGQRTIDGRLAFGGGGRYFYGSQVRDYFDGTEPWFPQLLDSMHELFPATRGTAITHYWGGPVGVARDWQPFVQFSTETGFGAAGGYAGSGVAATNLAGRTLAELALGTPSVRTDFPWVNHQSRRWELEPLRWLATAGVARLGLSSDRADTEGKRPRLRAAIFDGFAGH